MISTTIPRVAFYADGNYDYVDFRKESVDQIKTSMAGKGVLYLVIQEKDAVTFPEKMAVIEKNFIEATRYGEKGMEKIIVYQRVP